jgi:hypothetical protein
MAGSLAVRKVDLVGTLAQINAICLKGNGLDCQTPVWTKQLTGCRPGLKEAEV